MLLDIKPDVVINASGYTGKPNVDACEHARDDTWYYNVTVPGMIGDTCNRHDVKFIHISSGCIYDGYEKAFDEFDLPNFGLLSEDSSWYSKTKHAGELSLQGTDSHIFRIRMPFCETGSDRSVMSKLLKYNNIIDQLNSLTNIEDLCVFTEKYINKNISNNHPGAVLNVVNPQPVQTSRVVEIMKNHGLNNPKWTTIDLTELKKYTKANRSNCVLSTTCISKIGLSMPNTEVSLDRCARAMSHEYFTKISKQG
jgi:dTDP-4-dehydrorhamnose reductase